VKGLAWLGRPQVAMHSQLPRFLVMNMNYDDDEKLMMMMTTMMMMMIVIIINHNHHHRRRRHRQADTSKLQQL